MTSTPGRLALVGGNEFRRACDPLDRALLAAVGRAHPAVVILPTAATNENPYVAGENGRRHFDRLGARADKLMIVDAETANQRDLATPVEKADLIYLTSGDPLHLLESLRGTRTEAALRTVYARGGALVGSSAGAMVLGAQVWRFDGWAPGLAFAPHLAVLPHHATLAARWNAPALAAALPPGVTLVGIDEATALLLPEAQVLGLGQVTVYAADGPQTYASGAVIPALLPPALSSP
ncbi:MAG: Type 1 glutamine amidotransferase-like domain-containing protein [Anaerolineales bacterium]|nr:Type 1 glutamine amidotransferase-like domain-containing protein [Anaerolineales bacterium]